MILRIHKRWTNRWRVGISLFLLYTPSLHAELFNSDKVKEQAKQNIMQRFLEFTGDKNVMGKAKSADGQVKLGGNKSRFDNDDGLSYKSDLTYHDFSFKSDDESAQKQADPNDPNSKAQNRKLPAFISPHGGLSEGGGSSQLERTVYQEHKQKSEQQEQDPKKIEQQEKEQGVKFLSIFKISTQEVFPDAKGGGNQKGEPDKVERVEIVEEVSKKIEEVGENSAETIAKTARDKGFEDDENTMGNPLLYYEAGARAAEAWWNSTLANLSQRRMFKEIRGGLFGDSPTLSEGAASCDAWAQETQKSLENSKASAQTKQKMQEDMQKMVDKCKKMAKVKYDAVNPRFQDAEGNDTDDVQEQGEKKEDPFARDLRNQLEVLKKAGTSASKLKSNWKYEDKDDKARITTDYDENANPAGEGEETVTEQIESYNAQLDEAAKGFQKVKEAFPQLEINEEELSQYKIEPESTSIRDIMARPVQQELEEELGNAPGLEETAENYDQLIGQQGGE